MLAHFNVNDPRARRYGNHNVPLNLMVASPSSPHFLPLLSELSLCFWEATTLLFCYWVSSCAQLTLSYAVFCVSGCHNCCVTAFLEKIFSLLTFPFCFYDPKIDEFWSICIQRTQVFGIFLLANAPSHILSSSLNELKRWWAQCKIAHMVNSVASNALLHDGHRLPSACWKSKTISIMGDRT